MTELRHINNYLKDIRKTLEDLHKKLDGALQNPPPPKDDAKMRPAAAPLPQAAITREEGDFPPPPPKKKEYTREKIGIVAWQMADGWVRFLQKNGHLIKDMVKKDTELLTDAVKRVISDHIENDVDKYIEVDHPTSPELAVELVNTVYRDLSHPLENLLSGPFQKFLSPTTSPQDDRQ